MIGTKDVDTHNRGYGAPVIEVDACEPSETAEKAGLVGTSQGKPWRFNPTRSQYPCGGLYRSWHATIRVSNPYRNLKLRFKPTRRRCGLYPGDGFSCDHRR